MKNRIFAAGAVSLFVLVLGITTQVYACGCGSSGESLSTFEIATRELNRATAVFSGKVVRFEWREGKPGVPRQLRENLPWKTKVAILEVDKWWKPSLPDEVVLYSDEVLWPNGNGGNSSCNYNFIEGKSYLVFANGSEDELRANKCSPIGLIDLVSKDFLEALGKGNEPIKKFEAAKPKGMSRLFARVGLFSAG